MYSPNAVYMPKRIYNRLKSIYTEKLTVVCAPENFGKTTFLREFIRRSRSSARSCHFVNGYHLSVNECFERYCELLLGSREQIPITEIDFLRLRDRFEAAVCEKPLIIIMDSRESAKMVLNNLYCFRLITEHSPAFTTITCEELSPYHKMLIEQSGTDLIRMDELTLTRDESNEYLGQYGIAAPVASDIYDNIHGEILRTRLCAELHADGVEADRYELFPLLYNSVIRFLPRDARFAALCVCAFNIIDEQTCENLRAEPDIVEYYGSDDITLSSMTDGIEKINRALPNLWVNNKKRKYLPPEFAKRVTYRSFSSLPSQIKNAFLRCCAKDNLRCGNVFIALCQYCLAGEYLTAAALPTQGMIAFDYILAHRGSIFDIVTNVPLSCKPIIPKLVQMVAMLMLTDYKERARHLFRDIISYISASDDYTEQERNDILCYTRALRMYEEFYLIEKMGVHIKSAYEIFSGNTTFDPPFYSWSLYTPSIFSLLYQYSVPAYTQFEQFTRYHRMYTEMIHHGEYIEAVYTAEMNYYMGDVRKSLMQSLEVIDLCVEEKFIPTRLIAYKTAAKCALLLGNCEQYTENAECIADIARRYSSTETGDMAVLTLGMLNCLRHGGDEGIWQVISQEDRIIENNRYTAPFCYYTRCCYMLAHSEHELLLSQSPKYLSAAQKVRNETVEIMIRLTVATSEMIRGNTDEAMKRYIKVADMLGSTEMIMPVVEHCVNYPVVFRYAAKTLRGRYAELAERILSIAKPCIENIETVRTQELTEQSLAYRLSSKISESENGKTAADSTKLKELRLTSRALQYAALAADGFTNDEIAELTGSSSDSVKSSLKRTYSKLGITSRARLKSALAGII